MSTYGPTDVREEKEKKEKTREEAAAPVPWVTAEELQPKQRQVPALDEVDEAIMESFPCSDPPCYSHCHA